MFVPPLLPSLRPPTPTAPTATPLDSLLFFVFSSFLRCLFFVFIDPMASLHNLITYKSLGKNLGKLRNRNDSPVSLTTGVFLLPQLRKFLYLKRNLIFLYNIPSLSLVSFTLKIQLLKFAGILKIPIPLREQQTQTHCLRHSLVSTTAACYCCLVADNINYIFRSPYSRAIIFFQPLERRINKLHSNSSHGRIASKLGKARPQDSQ